MTSFVLQALAVRVKWDELQLHRKEELFSINSIRNQERNKGKTKKVTTKIKGDTTSLIGERCGSLTVLNFAYRIKKNNTYSYFWECACDCGTKCIVRRDHLKSKRVLSCGCRLSCSLEQFIRKVESLPFTPKGCQEWTGYIESTGYGRVRVQGERWSTHRLSYFVFRNSEWDEKLFVCHHCDNPKCVNPNHLFLGTHDDNMKDMKAKGRARKKRAAKALLIGKEEHPCLP